MRWMAVFGVVVVLVITMFRLMPGGFLPEEDQGYVITVVQAQPGSTTQRTSEVVGRLEKFYAGEPQTEGVVAVLGVSFFGSGQPAGLLFTALTDWDERPGADTSNQAPAGRPFEKIQGKLG